MGLSRTQIDRGYELPRDAALEAVIAEDPDRPEPYLVYADWLQARGDARGTLIALHDAVRREPSNTAAAAAAAALLETHGPALRGGLDQRCDVDLVWYQGFVREIRIRGRTGRQIVSALRALVDSAAGAFVHAITIVHAEEVDRAIAVLLETRRPRTLARLAIGRPSEWAVTPELIAAFPRLARDPAIEWAAALEAASAARRKLGIEIDPAALPPLEPRGGLPAAELGTILAGIKAEIAKQHPIGMLRALPLAIEREPLDRFALALAEQAEALGTPAARWAIDAIGALGGDRCAAYLADRCATWPDTRSVRALDHLRQIGSDCAVLELVRIAADATQPLPRRTQAREALERIVLERNLDSLTQLIARTCPRGLTGAAAAQAAATQRAWLAELMVAGHRLGRDDFFGHLAAHSLRRPLVAGLVWGAYTGGALRALFHLGPDGAPCDATGAPHELAAGAAIGLVHPLELAPDPRAMWRAWQARARRRGVALPFRQLDRPVFALEPAEAGAHALVRYAARRVGLALAVRLVERGWHHLTDDDDGPWYARELGRDDVVAEAQLDAGAVRTVRLRRTGDPQDRRLDAHHPVTISELLADLEHAHAGA